MSSPIEQIGDALNVSRDAVKKRAAREGWPYEERPVRGGRKRFYPLETLPEDVRAAVHAHLAARTARAPAAPAESPPAAPPPPAAAPALADPALLALSDAARAEAARRLALIGPILSGEARGRRAVEGLAARHGTTAATLYRYVRRYRGGGAAALADAPRRDRGQARVLLSAAWARFAAAAGIAPDRQALLAAEAVRTIRGLWAQQGVRSWAQVRELAAAALAQATATAAGIDPQAALPACRLSRRAIEAERRFAVVATRARDAKGFYDRVITPVRRDRTALRPAECVFGDVSPADIPVRRADGSAAWARLIVWQDAATNMIHVTAHVPDKGTGVRREHVAAAFAAMCGEAPWGMPRRLYLDNGAEFGWREMLDAWAELAHLTARAFEGVWGAEGAAAAGVVTRTIPFAPRAKPIESTFGSLLRLFGWCPAFAGSDRLRKKTRALGRPVEPVTEEALRAELAAVVPYYHALRQAGHLAGRSPAEAMAEAQAAGFCPVRPEPAALALAFAERREALVRRGGVTIDRVPYRHPKLHEIEGERVLIRWPRHAPERAFVFHRGRLWAVAERQPVFAWADPEGARTAARWAAEARAAVTLLAGQVSWLEPRRLMADYADLAGVPGVIAAADRAPIRIRLSPEAEAMRAAALQAEQRAAEAVLARAEAEVGANTRLKRFDVVDAEAEAEALRLGL